MVSWLREVVKHADLPLRLNGGGDNGIIKQLAIDDLRAGESKKDSTGFNSPHSLHVQSLISAHGLMARIAMFGKGRGIQNDDIVFVLLVFQEIKSICGEAPVGVRIEVVECNVFSSEIDRLL